MKRKAIDTGGERDIGVLLKKHRSALEDLRILIEDDIAQVEGKHRDMFDGFDDVFMLSYLLSFGRPELAIEPIRKAISFKVENESWLGPASRGEPFEKAPKFESLASFMCSVPFNTEQKTRDGDNFLFIVRSGPPSDLKGLMKVATPEDVANIMTYSNERQYFECRKATRARQRLTKIISVNDMTGFGASSFDLRFARGIGISSKRGEFLCPQMIEKPVFFNPPGIFAKIYSVVKPLLSKNLVEKAGVCPCPGGGLEGDIAKCPFASSNLAKATLPVYLGGEAPDELG
mmetsp:Transcript_6783/g.16380  ORF Transcript_6783/g.16380 Transcript_6783/m.16380 type:complete len:288 (+) Transcript_6783:58-921(+)